MSAILFTNVRVFEGTGDALEPAEVLVQGNRIKTVARGGQHIARSKAAEVVDGGGATLMPGLVNPHCHFTYNNATSIADITALPVEEHMLVTMRNLATYLDYGFTAVIGMASAKPRLEVVARNAVAAGHYPGPRIRACTPEYTVTGGLGDDNRLDREIPSIGLICNGADEFRRSIREQIREGVDIVKFNNSGDSLTMGGLPGDINPMTDDEVRTICETTHRLGRRVAAHAHADSGVLQCIEHGVEFINHATFASEATIEKLARVADRHWVTPAIAARYNTTYEASDWGITEDLAEAIGNKREFESGCRSMTLMHEAGIRVLPFGDYGFAWIPIGSDARDLEHMVNYFGMQPWQALRAATAYGGEAWAGADGDKLGRVKAGYLADLIVVDGDPIADITVLQDRSRITAVMKDGHFHRRPAAGEPFAAARPKRRRRAA
ncbi:MAG: amidohydrolase family protein [Gammaproteobacteria bacterium]|nr:amidohydrolase family protein [Gammaproteobacteria bacterium]MCP5201287.1 amidohydrolase family protein [Gammaproteobacteria bacterium]